MLILDTDLLTIVQRGKGPEFERLVQRLNAAGETVAVTIVSFEEQMRGWLAYIAQAQSDERQLEGYARLRALLEDFQTRPIIDYDAPSIAEFRRLRKAKVRLGTVDLKIAAMALAHKTMLLARNLADFRKVPELQAEDWTAIPAPGQSRQRSIRLELERDN